MSDRTFKQLAMTSVGTATTQELGELISGLQVRAVRFKIVIINAGSSYLQAAGESGTDGVVLAAGTHETEVLSPDDLGHFTNDVTNTAKIYPFVSYD